MNFAQRSLSTASFAPLLARDHDFGTVGEQRRALMEGHFVNAKLFREGRKNADQRLADGSGADDVYNLFFEP